MTVSAHDPTATPDPLGQALAATLADVDGELSTTAPRPFATGEDRYAPGRVLGRGGMGTVYVARDAQFGREVALKQMMAEQASTQGMRRFLQEAVVTANLEHPGIPAVYERGVRDGRLFYTMRKVEGRTLAQAVEQAGSFEERIALLPAILRVSHTLGFAHERGVVHRDVKPDNVILGEHGETVLLDWGIARVEASSLSPSGDGEATSVSPEATTAGQVMGTPAYMAPEQAAGRIEDIDARTDVFALGAMLYFVITGQAPYDGPSPVAALARAVAGEREPVARLAPKTPEALVEVVDRAMATDPRDRHRNAASFADALEHFMTSTVTARPSRWIRALGTASGLVVLVGVMLLGVAVLELASSFEGQGIAAYVYSGLAAIGFLLGAIEWVTRGRHHLSHLVLAFAVTTFLVGLTGTVLGFAQVLRYVSAHPELDPSAVMRQGLWEMTGLIPLSAVLTAGQITLWAMARRAAGLAADEQVRRHGRATLRGTV